MLQNPQYPRWQFFMAAISSCHACVHSTGHVESYDITDILLQKSQVGI